MTFQAWGPETGRVRVGSVGASADDMRFKYEDKSEVGLNGNARTSTDTMNQMGPHWDCSLLLHHIPAGAPRQSGLIGSVGAITRDAGGGGGPAARWVTQHLAELTFASGFRL